ncbi:MAG: methyltransferase [Gemmatimonas sp. SG8_38_2]|nr:MAG: methyltransferase [Gemmatimonas sp. SG8_38_2]
MGQLLGSEIFLGVEMHVSTDVLAPRKETELLGRSAIQRLREDGVEQPTVIDMCCGGGNLACAIATHLPEARIWASDITEACVELARRNVERLGLGARVQVLRGDLFSSFENEGLEGKVDLVVCNPPYISTGRLEGDRASLLAHEPREAFDGGPYGLSIQQRVMREAVPYVRHGGTLAFEIGLGQERQVVALFKRVKLEGKRAWDEPELVNDSAGQPRVALARRDAS